MIQNFEGLGNVERCRGGALLKLIVFLVILGGILVAAWVFFLPATLTGSLQKRTDFSVSVQSLAFNPFNARVDMKGLVLNNPRGFPRSEFMAVNRFEANAKFATLFSDRVELDYARVDVAYVALVRDASGVLNAQLFHDRISPPVPLTPEEIEQQEKIKAAAKAPPSKLIRDGKEITVPKPPPPAPPPVAKHDNKAPLKPMRYLIHRLEVRLEKVIIVDYTTTPVTIREFNTNLHYAFNEVTDPKQLLKPFAFKSLESVGTAIKALIPGDIGRTVDATTTDGDLLFGSDKSGTNRDPLRTVVEKLEESQKP